MGKKKNKFTLKGLIHRTKKVDIYQDIVVDGEVVYDQVVAWVEIRGSGDPVYVAKARDVLINHQSNMSEDPTEEETKEYHKYFLDASVAVAIVGWDKEYFGTEFSFSEAMDLFQDDANIVLYNQLAHYMQQASDFLPLAS